MGIVEAHSITTPIFKNGASSENVRRASGRRSGIPRYRQTSHG